VDPEYLFACNYNEISRAVVKRVVSQVQQCQCNRNKNTVNEHIEAFLILQVDHFFKL
jgi:hypothetical protein